MFAGTMPPKNASLSKQVTKKSTKPVPVANLESNSFEFKASTKSSSEFYDDSIRGKVVQKGKAVEKAKGKKKVPQESESLAKGPRRKNSMVSPPHTSPLFDDDEDDEAKSSSKDVNSELAKTIEDVNEVPSIIRRTHHLLLPLPWCPLLNNGGT